MRAHVPVDQTLFGGPDDAIDQLGNCYPACLATLLGVTLDDVPHVYAQYPRDPGAAEVTMRAYLATRGIAIIATQWVADASPIYHAGLCCIVSGKSPRLEDCLHAVVGRVTADGWELLHDPHPSRAGIVGEPTMVEFLSYGLCTYEPPSTGNAQLEEKAWGINDEAFTAHSLAEALSYMDAPKAGDTVYVGVMERPAASALFSADSLLDDLRCAASDVGGEYAEDWLDDVTPQQVRELESLVEGWIDRHHPRQFWTVRDTQTYVLTEADIATGGAP